MTMTMTTTNNERLTALLSELAAMSPLPEDDDVTVEELAKFERIMKELDPVADETAVEPLLRSISAEGGYGLHWMVMHMVERQPVEVLRPILTRLLKEGPLGARVWSAAILGRFHDPQNFEALREALSDPSDEVQVNAIVALSGMRHEGILGALEEMPIRSERVMRARDRARDGMAGG